MCGICGFSDLDQTKPGDAGMDMEVLSSMMEQIRHRGPDDSGTYVSDRVSLGHLRLSIIDLVSGKQPIFNEDGSVVVVFNGEIYNYKELQKELVTKGHSFTTESDTEVLVHLYEEHGTGFLNKLNGIFAFALWDQCKNLLFLVRDPFGVKPLHYTIAGGKFLFGSEIKALLCNPDVTPQTDRSSLHSFLNVRFIPGTRTLFEGIHRLGAGQFLTVQNGETHIETYYTLPSPNSVIQSQSEQHLAEQVRASLKKAVQRQLMSDVPLGAYLSGGIDSSGIVAMMKELNVEQVNTYCLGFNEPTDELPDALKVSRAFNTKHHEHTITSDPLKYLPTVIWHVEEPQINILQGYMVSKFASEHVKVVLSGLGGDELFCGYTINRFVWWAQKVEHSLPEKAGRFLGKQISNWAETVGNAVKNPGWEQYFRGIQLLSHIWDRPRFYGILRNAWDFQEGMMRRIYTPEWRSNLISPSVTSHFEKHLFPSQEHFSDQVLRNEFHLKMVDDFLLSEDRVSMAHGLESRVPFLDKDLVELAFQIPADQHIKNNRTKHLLKMALKPHLPEDILNKKKWGFTFDSYYQFQKDLKEVSLKILTPEKVRKRGIFNYSFIREIQDHPPDPRMRWHYFVLWMILGVEVWMQMFIDNGGNNPEMELEAYFDR